MIFLNRTLTAPHILAAMLLTFTISHAQLSDTVRINCGGPNYTDASGKAWAADSGYTGGQTYSENTAISNTPDQTLYQTERWDSSPFSYNFNMKPGNYTVSLYEASLYAAVCNAGGRVFNVAINGTAVLTNYDMYNEVGCLTAQIKQFPVTTSNGKIKIDFTLGSASNPKIDAISIIPSTGSSIFNGRDGKSSKFSVTNAKGSLAVQTQATGAYTLELLTLQGKRIGYKHGFGFETQSFTRLNPGLYLLSFRANHETITRMISVVR
ncbi:MAG TPA: hypothetical protein DCQ83_04010 [Fibrobacteres bacterium]|mgnify:FL=1|jgi:hypothetical protein|nr:hypothetical protein [Fibrobacterota bacterium]